MQDDPYYKRQLERARKLLQTVRHAAYATVNEDGTPHNSPLMLIYNEDLSRLYIGSHSESRHVKNLVRTGRAFAVLYDSFTIGQGGLYITGRDGHECTGDELVEALRVHNLVRARQGNEPLDIAYYQSAAPAQRMYSITIDRAEIYTAIHDENGLMVSEARVEVDVKLLMQ